MKLREASYCRNERSRRAIGSSTLGLAAGLAFALVGTFASPRAARADEIDDAVKKLIDLDQRVHLMSLEFKEAPPPAPDAADRRVLDAQVQLSVKNYDEAATIALDVVEKYPNTRAYDDALYLLGEALFQGHDYYSARHYLQEAVAKNNGSKPEQQALQRLVEVALRTGDYENVDVYLKRLENLPPSAVEPSVPYVRAKYLYFRGRLDEAAAVFAAIPATNPYYFQARYFLATIQVKKGDLAGASTAYDALLKQQAPDEAGKDIQDLARLAIARILYERSQFDKAIEVYLAVPRQSRYWSEALREQAWTYIKAKDWQRAYRSVNLLLLYDPDVADAPDLRLLEGNLELRMNNFYLASDEFSKVRDEFEPIHRQLQQVIVKSQTDPAYFDSLVGKSLDKFDIGVFVPPTAAKWVKAEPDVARMMSLASDVGEMQRDISDSQKLVERIEHAMEGTGKVGIFPDLAAARTKSVESMNQVVSTRGEVRAEDPGHHRPGADARGAQAARPAGDPARRLLAPGFGFAHDRRGAPEARALDEGPFRRSRQAGLGDERRDPGAGGAAGGAGAVLPGVALRAEDPAGGHGGAGARHARRDRGPAHHARQAARTDRRRHPRGERRRLDGPGGARGGAEALRRFVAGAGHRAAGGRAPDRRRPRAGRSGQ